jgi:hypothetical protein
VSRANQWARWIAKPCRRLFAARAMPDLQVPSDDLKAPASMA